MAPHVSDFADEAKAARQQAHLETRTELFEQLLDAADGADTDAGAVLAVLEVTGWRVRVPDTGAFDAGLWAGLERIPATVIRQITDSLPLTAAGVTREGRMSPAEEQQS